MSKTYVAYTASPIYLQGMSRGIDGANYALAYESDADTAECMDRNMKRIVEATPRLSDAERSVFSTGYASGWEQYMATHSNDMPEA